VLYWRCPVYVCAGLGEPDMFKGMDFIIVILIVALLFGVKRLPEIGKSLGEAMREFKKAMNTEEKPSTPPPAVEEEKKP